MTLSGQGLNFTFLLKANGKQNKKAVQTSVNLEKNGLQQQFRSFPILFEMVYPFLTLDPRTSLWMFDAALSCHLQGLGADCSFTHLLSGQRRARCSAATLCTKLNTKSHNGDAGVAVHYTLTTTLSAVISLCCTDHEVCIFLPPDINALSLLFLFLTPRVQTAFSLKNSQTGWYPIKL